MASDETIDVWTVAPSLHLRCKYKVQRKAPDAPKEQKSPEKDDSVVDCARYLTLLYNTLPKRLELPVSLIDLCRQCECRIVSKETAPETPDLPPGHRPWEESLGDFLRERKDLKPAQISVFKHVVVLKILKHLLSFEQAWAGEGSKREAVLHVEDMEQHKIVPGKDYPWLLEGFIFADFALSLNLTHLGTNRMSNYPPSHVPNQISSDSTESFPRFASVIVHDTVAFTIMKEQDRMFRWTLAEFQKRYNEGLPLEFPYLAIEVHGDSWYLWVHVGQRRMEDEDLEWDKPIGVEIREGDIQIWSMGPSLLGSTKDEYSALVLMANLVDVAGWGIKEYSAWYEEHYQKAKRGV